METKYMSLLKELDPSDLLFPKAKAAMTLKLDF